MNKKSQHSRSFNNQNKPIQSLSKSDDSFMSTPPILAVSITSADGLP